MQCEQADVHAPLVTVREALQFSAALRMTAGCSSSSSSDSSASVSRAVAVAAAVDEVLEWVELTGLAGRLLGTPGELMSENSKAVAPRAAVWILRVGSVWCCCCVGRVSERK